MSLLLKNKIAVVTGSTRGIGFAIAKEFAENNGATTVVCSRNNEQAKRAIRQISSDKVFAAEIDVTSYPIDNNIWYKRFHVVTDEELQKIMGVDVQGSVRLSRAVISSMIQKNTNKNSGGGVIINISSTPAIVGHTEGAPYTIAKAANIALTKCIAKEYGIDGVRSYTMALGNIATMATYDSMTEVARNKAAEEPPMKRWGRPEEVAKIAASIASDSFSFATGNTIVIDGGTVLW